MKKSVIALVLGLMLAAPFANAADRNQRNNQQRGHQSQEDRREEAIVAGVLGGIIGLIAAEALDNDNGRHSPRDRYDRNDRGGRDDWGRGPARNRTLFCFAQNRRGEIFRARGQSARIAQEKALDKCYQASRMCRPAGCQY